jgi:hypothetical protein
MQADEPLRESLQQIDILTTTHGHSGYLISYFGITRTVDMLYKLTIGSDNSKDLEPLAFSTLRILGRLKRILRYYLLLTSWMCCLKTQR